MDIISYTEARQNLAATMDKVSDGDVVIITRRKAEAVVMISLEDFNSMQETMYLLGCAGASPTLKPEKQPESRLKS